MSPNQHVRVQRPLALLLAVVTTLAAALVAVDTGRAGAAASAPSASRGVLVAHNGAGKMRAKIVGHTSSGQRVTGSFVPLRFVKRAGHLKVRGLVRGVVHHGNGTTSTFAAMRTIQVKSINGRSLRGLTAGRPYAAARSCGILNLVLAPLDLDLLGLQVHLDRVVLNVVAQSGAGKLLGNLLCAVTGLLDGGLGGLLGQIRGLLNQILGALNLGG
jgi:hypothetical protein